MEVKLALSFLQILGDNRGIGLFCVNHQGCNKIDAYINQMSLYMYKIAKSKAGEICLGEKLDAM